MTFCLERLNFYLCSTYYLFKVVDSLLSICSLIVSFLLLKINITELVRHLLGLIVQEVLQSRHLNSLIQCWKKNKIKAGLTSSLPPVLQLVQRGLVALGGEAGATLAKPTAAVLALITSSFTLSTASRSQTCLFRLTTLQLDYLLSSADVWS